MRTAMPAMLIVGVLTVGSSFAGLASPQPCKTLSPTEAASLFGGVDNRMCGDAPQCEPVMECNPSATNPDCSDVTKNRLDQRVFGSAGRDCTEVVKSQFCKASGSEACILTNSCWYDPAGTGTCTNTSSIVDNQMAPSACEDD